MSVYALADLHGRLDLLKEIQAFLQPEDTVYFLGDACDRGPDPWDTVKAIIDDDRFIYLLGNHEDMLLNTYLHHQMYDIDGDIINNPEGYLWYKNGGYQTAIDMMADPNRDKYINVLRTAPLYKIYTNTQHITCFLSHAGASFKRTVNEEDLLWDRDHIYDKWNEEEWPDVISVHGHTPTPSLWRLLNTPKEEMDVGAFWYCNNHKVDIDTFAHSTNISVLLDLDTFDEHILQIPIK